MPVLWEIDPTSEDASNAPLALTTDPLRLMGMDLTPPAFNPIFASSADTEGDPS